MQDFIDQNVLQPNDLLGVACQLLGKLEKKLIKHALELLIAIKCPLFRIFIGKYKTLNKTTCGYRFLIQILNSFNFMSVLKRSRCKWMHFVYMV